MKTLILSICLISVVSSLNGQKNYIHNNYHKKTAVDTNSYFNWVQIERDRPVTTISNNGKWVIYSVKNIPIKSNSLIIRNLIDHREILLGSIDKAEFSNDSRRVIYLKKGILCIETLENNEIKTIDSIKSYKLFMKDSVEMIACQSTGIEENLIFSDLTLNNRAIFKHVKNAYLSNEGHFILLKISDPNDSKGYTDLKVIDIFKNSSRSIWIGNDPEDILLDDRNGQVAFICQDIAKVNSLWFYKWGDESPTKKLDDNLEILLGSKLVLSRIKGFDKSGHRLYLMVKKKDVNQRAHGVQVNVWSYLDPKLQSQQLFQVNAKNSYLAVAALDKSNRLLRLQKENEEVVGWINDRNEDSVLLEYREGDYHEKYWNKKSVGKTFLVSVDDGGRRYLPLSFPTFSKSGKFITGYNATENFGSDIMVYDRNTGNIKNLTANLPIPKYESAYDMQIDKSNRGLEIAAWVKNDSAVLIYDYYDIWQIDPLNKKTPIRLTNGRNRKWKFRLIKLYKGKEIDLRESLVAAGFNLISKQSGFFKISLDRISSCRELFKGDYIFESLPDKQNKMFPIKSKDSSVYLVLRENCSESPNIFSTSDFSHFEPVTKICPEREIIWFTSKLVSFPTLRGCMTQGVLYMPDNFDPRKKYPIIIHYYEKRSDEKNMYQLPPVRGSGSHLDIAWFASHGYLILLVDIRYKIGNTGRSSYDAVVGAVRYLSNMQFVDIKHIGLQGHSFGAYETNYVVTHSKLFAAAISSSGMSDLATFGGNLWPLRISRFEYLEQRGGRIGATPWERPDLYLKNSPIYFVGNVTTPILMVNNRKDWNVEFGQGLVFFNALRRAGKRVWMLEYENGNHGVEGEDYKDYLMRSTQFFDHYLRNEPAPKWMTRGIPSYMKDENDGFEPDSEIKTPGQGLLKDHGMYDK